MMNSETVAQIDSPALPAELKTALMDLLQAADRFLAEVNPHIQYRYRYYLDRVVKEACDASLDLLWWESMLDLTARAARESGDAGRPFVDAAGRLVPIMQTHLGPDGPVELRSINDDNVIPVCRLSDTLSPPQSYMVAPNAISLAQALVNPNAWYRAIVAGRELVGFIMLADNPAKPEYFLWRFMIAAPCQGRGYGAGAIRRLVEYVRTRPGARELLVSCGEGEGSPRGFYERQGFVSTGEVIDDELVLTMALD
jgi:GNAT superfamily N-acetyltransferase